MCDRTQVLMNQREDKTVLYSPLNSINLVLTIIQLYTNQRAAGYIVFIAYRS